MTEDLQGGSSPGGESALVYRLCRHTYAGTLHITNLWWSDSEEPVLGTGALPERTWLDGQGRAHLEVDLGSQPVRLQVLSNDARDCLTPITTYHEERRGAHIALVREIADEVAREVEAMKAATRGIAFSDAWLAVLEQHNLGGLWRAEMIAQGYEGDAALDSPYQLSMPARLVQQARKTWEAAYDGAQLRHAALIAEWTALRAAEAPGAQT